MQRFFPVDDPAAFHGLCLRAEGDAACGRSAALGERLRIDRAVLDDALVMNRAPPFVLGAGLSVHVEIVGKRT